MSGSLSGGALSAHPSSLALYCSRAGVPGTWRTSTFDFASTLSPSNYCCSCLLVTGIPEIITAVAVGEVTQNYLLPVLSYFGADDWANYRGGDVPC